MSSPPITANILIVDDLPDNLRLLAATLTDCGYEVRSAINAPIALMGIEAQRPDLILLDINMPEINGYELCRQLKMQPETANIPIIFISAMGEGLDKKKAFTVGGADYITKPFQIEEVLARVQQQLNIQRTNQQLEQKNEHLTQTLTQLKQTQSQLIQTEKIAALGKMVAGIAHEINNPATFIQGNLEHIQEYFHGLMKLVNKYQECYPESRSDIQNLSEEIEFDYISKDFEKIIESMTTGTIRIQEIVNSLRQFSRLDEVGKKTVDIHHCVESVLSILNGQHSSRQVSCPVDIQKQYGVLPPVHCFPMQINQALFNILENALEALQTMKSPPKKPCIVIDTQFVSDINSICIRVQDNGQGIPPEHISQIWNPFFTTKPIGEGPGLGLSISHQIIVEQHDGQLLCESSLGKGTTFTLHLPVD